MSRRTIVLVVALLLAGIAAFAIWNFLSNVDDEAREGVEEVAVYRATELIIRGTDGDQALALIVEGTENREFLPDSAITTQDQLEAVLRGRVAIGPISAGQIVTTDVWGDPVEAVASLSELIAPGMQAVSIRPDEVRAVGGFIRPGDRVNIIASTSVELVDFIRLLRAPAARAIFFPGLQEQLGYDDEQMSELADALPTSISLTIFVLQDLNVLAVGAEAGVSEEDSLVGDGEGTEGTATVGTQIITLEVDAVTAERLVFTQEFLSTWLTLVPTGFEPEVTPGAEFEDLVDIPAQIIQEIEERAGLVGP